MLPNTAKDPHACTIGRYFDRHGLHETDYGLAHKAFHAVMARYGEDTAGWLEGADRVRTALSRAILCAAPTKEPSC